MGQKIGLDTSVFIYLYEDNERYLPKVQKILYDVKDGKNEAVFSSVGMIEILTGPKQEGNHAQAAKYRLIINTFPNLTIAGINENIIELASDLRAKYGISTPDAIHLATAIDFGAQRFVTNDRSLQKVKEIEVEVL